MPLPFAQPLILKWPLKELLLGAQKSLMILILSEEMAQNMAFVSNLNKMLAKAPKRNFKLVVFDLEQQAKGFLQNVTNVSKDNVIDVLGLGEYALRRTAVGLISLHEATRLLSIGSKRITKEPRFFVSHAKIDGQSLATS